MGLTSSLFVGLSGMQTNESRMDVIGNNISNVNTYAYKSQRVSFQTQFYNTLNFGSASNGSYGGTNPLQIGSGATVGAITKDFSSGSTESTGIMSDVAIQGEGMFIVQDTEGANHYTRDGSFQFNSENYLLSSDGYYVQGYGIDSDFNIIEGTLSRLRIPLGEITTAESTSNVSFSGDLNSSGQPALVDDGTNTNTFISRGEVRSTISSDALSVDMAGVFDATTLLVDLRNADGDVLFEEGNVISLEKAKKGGVTLPTETLIVEAGTTLGEYVSWLEGSLGINTDINLSDLDGDAVADITPEPGVTINTVDNTIDIVCNMGDDNVIDLSDSAIKIQKGTAVNDINNSVPISYATTNSNELVEVESVRTSFTAYDSLGTPMDVDLTIVMLSKTSGGITWRYYAESSDDTDASRVLGTGTITFDSNGQFVSTNDGTISIDRKNTGAVTPQTINISFEDMDGYAMTNSAISLLSQDGFQSGTLQDYSIGSDGVITGSFTNGLTRQLGQIAIATFRNYEGLIAESDNLYSLGPNSGNPIVKSPGELGSGTIAATALELSNVDLSKEFINLIVSSTGFSAASKVITTSNDLLTQLINLTR